MATKEMKVCDIYGTTKEAETYRLSLQRVDVNGKTETDVEVSTDVIDLCPRALTRLRSFVKRGLTSPSAV